MADALRAIGIWALVALALGGCGSSNSDSAAATAATVVVGVPVAEQAPAAVSPQDATDVTAAPSAEPPQPRATVALNVPPGTYPVIWVRAGQQVRLRTERDGGELVERAGRRTSFGSPAVFGVADTDHGWAGVPPPLLPNSQRAWLKLDPKRLEAGWTRLSIDVDLSERSAELRDGDRVVRAFPVTIGAPGSETPTGRFAVTDTFRGGLDQAAYGCCALALSATQPNLPSGWLGGNRIAIHGTSSVLGVAASHGCMRAADRNVSKLVDEVPLGTPVFIRE